MREPGFYWLWRDPSGWFVAEWYAGAGHTYWRFTNGGYAQTYRPEWIGPRIEPPQEAPCQP